MIGYYEDMLDSVEDSTVDFWEGFETFDSPEEMQEYEDFVVEQDYDVFIAGLDRDTDPEMVPSFSEWSAA